LFYEIVQKVSVMRVILADSDTKGYQVSTSFPEELQKSPTLFFICIKGDWPSF
jgi:hypothetical protein